jgi:hypothetical protein
VLILNGGLFGCSTMYLPVIVIGVAVVFTAAQALLVRFEKQK